MDEHTLNDLLECSICLDRLDTSSKVLPCQHTFCRKCLEAIVSSHSELRCPECRILVDIKIDDLPPNVLLMRILEGMKHAAASKIQQNKLEVEANVSVNEQHDHKSSQESVTQSTSVPVQHLQQQQKRCVLPYAYALFDFISTETSHLNFKKGDLILLKRKIDNRCYMGQCNGKEGTFPVNYVKVIVPLPSPQCIALYDFKMGPNEEEGCLNFKKGTIIHVIRRVDHNWAEGRIGTTIGIFPIAFVELNTLARQLLDNYVPASRSTSESALTSNMSSQSHLDQSNISNQQHQLTQTSSCLPTIPMIDQTEYNSSTSTLNSISPKTNSTDSSTSSSLNCSPNQSHANTPQHKSCFTSVRYRGKSEKEKRHSLNALLSLNNSGQSGLSFLHSNRHSAEILSVPHDPNILASNGESQSGIVNLNINEKPQHSIIQVNDRPDIQNSIAFSVSTAHSAHANVLKSGVSQNVSPTLPWGFLALYPYKPCKNDELELEKGCVYIVTEYLLDGWCKGTSYQGNSGFFPGNYVTPLRVRDQQQLMHQRKYLPSTTNNQSFSTVGNNFQSIELQINLGDYNHFEHINTRINSFLPLQPPDLPHRQSFNNLTQIDNIAVTPTCSVWSKPLGQTVEAFFNRNKINSNNAFTYVHTNKKDNIQGQSTSKCSSTVSLMKRLTQIKTRSKSSSAQLQHQQSQSNIVEENNSVSVQLHPIHVRSGSCPSQLLQSLPNDHPSINQRTDQTQVKQSSQTLVASKISYGSQRIKSNKDRPNLVCARQSLDATAFRYMYSSATTPPPATTYTQQLPCITHQQVQNLSNQMHSSLVIHPDHRKSQSLETNRGLAMCGSSGTNTILDNDVSSIPCNFSEAAIKASATTKSTQSTHESRFRCVVPYPPNSDIELELHVGDIIYVQCKQKNGWYKGTHARSKRTGLFPASFVEPDI